MTKIFTLGRSREQWGSRAEGRHGGGGPRRRGCAVVGRRGQGEDLGIGRLRAGGQASGIWGHGDKGGSSNTEVGGGVEGGGGGAEVGGGIEGGNAEVG
jgi:hypothetical protein